MKEKTFKDLGLDDDNGKMKKLETVYNLDELFGQNAEDINFKINSKKNTKENDKK